MLDLYFWLRAALPPLEVATTIGALLFALTWVAPRRWVTFPAGSNRVRTLTITGTLGALFVVGVGAAVSAHIAATADGSGFDDWWRRPTPLWVAAVVVAAAGVALRERRNTPAGALQVRTLRDWRHFTSPGLTWTWAAIAGALVILCTWHIAIATRAPADALFLGDVPHPTDLPIFVPFQGGFAFVGGAGWPNHVGTLIVVGIAAAVGFVALRVDANRRFVQGSPSILRAERTATSRLLLLILLGGLLLTFGAVCMHIGATGGASIGLAVEEANGALVYVGGGIGLIARPLNLFGYFSQACGAALLMRLAVDTARAAYAGRRSRATLPAEISADGAVLL
ncbi:hypothetical protein [Microbacterium phyllosphaerae]|uniref:hypothetical protein n=1 Tax=Microbacterium phyllosphaerae TaxID=124798 RepID=UPI0021685DFF|nr:hypothetical protein [Microbacterium phyllosphaerae]MCS3442175.1 hypothetical protein [Microbacterium phyllosphaerae]